MLINIGLSVEKWLKNSLVTTQGSDLVSEYSVYVKPVPRPGRRGFSPGTLVTSSFTPTVDLVFKLIWTRKSWNEARKEKCGQVSVSPIQTTHGLA